MTSKSLFASKTFWTNVIAAVAAVGGAAGLADIPPEEQAALVGGVMAVANIILRLVTRSAVHIKPKELP